MDLFASLDLREAATLAPASDHWRRAVLFALYFTGPDCPACVKFTPNLRVLYEGVNEEARQLEVLALLRDCDAGVFKAYTAKMPWLALAPGDGKIAELWKEHRPSRLPALIVMDARGRVLSREGWMELSLRGEDAYEAWLEVARASKP